MHLATTFADDAHDLRMRYGGAYSKRALVKSLRDMCELIAGATSADRLSYLQALVVPSLGIHLDLQRVGLHAVRAFARIVCAVLALACLV